METKKNRRLVAIMFTDIVGYSSIMQNDEEQGFKIRQRHRKVFEELTDKYNGEILQYFGDGTLSVFSSASSAVECGVEMQKEFQASPKVPLRIGIHTGDITFTEDDAYGHGMNIAARIEPICIPGGVYISGKVNQDISNHLWLTTKSLGYYELKNINDAIEVFAVTNKGVNTPEYEVIDEPDQEYIPPTQEEYTYQNNGFKNRKKAAFIALILGSLGAHRFYLNQRKLGIAHFVPWILGIIGGVWFLIVIPALIGFIDAVTLFAMSNAEFDFKHNKAQQPEKKIKKEIPLGSIEVGKKEVKGYVEPISELTTEQKAQKSIKIGDFESAIEYYDELLETDQENSEIHFSLAISYSMNQDAKNGFYHLSKAVEYGYDNFEKIKNHFTLAFLRSRNDFKSFEKNGFRLIKMLPSPQENLLDTERPLLLEKLEKIEELAVLLDNGEITEEEFSHQKKNLLSD